MLSLSFEWSGQRGITVGGHFEAGEGFLCVKVVTLSTGNTAGEEGVSTVRLLITPALVTPETVTCRGRLEFGAWCVVSLLTYMREKT